MPNPFEEAAAKGLGAVKAVKGAIQGLHGVFNTLVQQHGEVSALLSRASVSDDSQKRLELWSKIRTELLSHEKGELEVLYPAYREYEELRYYADAHEKEAEQLAALIGDLDAIETGAAEWKEKLEELILTVKAHVEDEETRFFPEAAEIFSREQSAELDQKFKANKEAIAANVAH
ncbi:MAG: hemerythrin domain-containing protein [Myxococcaceae bacterium]|nr:hemerythrin domain-containing protein [Myxococcaceae bacterium]